MYKMKIAYTKKTLNERLKISADTIVEYSEDKNFFKILYIKKAEILLKSICVISTDNNIFPEKIIKKGTIKS